MSSRKIEVEGTKREAADQNYYIWTCHEVDNYYNYHCETGPARLWYLKESGKLWDSSYWLYGIQYPQNLWVKKVAPMFKVLRGETDD
jgi:hypothetical protein